MAKKVVDGRCPHCGSSDGFYKKTMFRVQQDYSFDNPYEPNAAWYTQVSGGERTQCLKCDKQIEITS
ncbi:TPA: hypothetical protein ACMDS2_004280 [Vibrio parahaemolyticus]|uniref:hypothetical protein n=1 Tax=Vibrio diabolicus TaxID=50719 RepID=UPI00211BACD6|nr:hypothetical protein [Vibrio diabolicus]MCQ9247820.1 hypothetical protein [Vibrio diabolicus]